MNPAPCLADFVGKDFAWGGRGPDTYDCYGLVKAVQAARGIELPEYASVSDKALIHQLVMAERELFVPLERPEPWCVVALAIHPRFVSHVGVVIDDSRRFIHVMAKTRVSIERLDAPEWAKRIRGFYRWQI